jgi:hypothetical protein
MGIRHYATLKRSVYRWIVIMHVCMKPVEVSSYEAFLQRLRFFIGKLDVWNTVRRIAKTISKESLHSTSPIYELLSDKYKFTGWMLIFELHNESQTKLEIPSVIFWASFLLKNVQKKLHTYSTNAWKLIITRNLAFECWNFWSSGILSSKNLGNPFKVSTKSSSCSKFFDKNRNMSRRILRSLLAQLFNILFA